MINWEWHTKLVLKKFIAIMNSQWIKIVATTFLKIQQAQVSIKYNVVQLLKVFHICFVFSNKWSLLIPFNCTASLSVKEALILFYYLVMFLSKSTLFQSMMYVYYREILENNKRSISKRVLIRYIAIYREI